MRRWRAACLACGLLAATAASGGDIAGVVKLSGTAPPTVSLPVTKDRTTCGESIDDDSLVAVGGRLANVVVTVRGAPAPPPGRGTLDQQRCRYLPRVQALPVGSTLEVRNGDPVLHSVHGWMGKASRFDLVMPEQGERSQTRLDRPGLVQVRCDVHAWMRAYVVVVDAPAAVSAGDGTFTVRGVPPGTYTLAAWHERLGERTATVTVPERGEARVELAFEAAAPAR